MSLPPTSRRLAQIAPFEQQRQTLAADAEQIDVETAVLDELTSIRAMVAGQVKGDDSVTAVRAALRRVFERFELVDWPGFGAGPPSGGAVVWQWGPALRLPGQKATRRTRGQLPLALVPYVRREVIDVSTESPVVERVSLALRSNGGNPLRS